MALSACQPARDAAGVEPEQSQTTSARGGPAPNYGLLLFPPGREKVLASESALVEPEAEPASAWPPPEPGAFAQQDFFVEDRKEPLTKEWPLECKPPWRCSREALGAPFRASGTFQSLRAIRMVGEDSQGTAVVIQTTSGFGFLPATLRAQDPDDPGCPSLVRHIAIEQARVEQELLVVVLLGETMSGDELQLVREVVLAKVDGASLRTRRFQRFGGPELGFKSTTRRRGVDWGRLPWQGFEQFRVDPQGKLTVLP